MSTLYDVLGVAANATQEAIKRAYKKKAQKLHPDKHNGDDSGFKAIAKAYEILSNEDLRKRYDETGDTTTVDNKRSDMLQELAGLLFNIIEAMPDVESKDVVSLMRKNIEMSIERQHSEIKKNEERIEKKKKVLKRLKVKKGKPNLMGDMIAAANREHLKINDEIKKSIKHGYDLLDTLANYDYETNNFTTGSYEYTGVAASLSTKHFTRGTTGTAP
jgi:curved DNA-binding protein CbpA